MKPSLKTIYAIGFLFSLHTALITYSNSSFLNQFVSESSTGLLYTAGSFLAIFGLITVPRLIKKIGSRLTMVIIAFILITVYMINIFVANPIVIAIAFCFLFAANIMFFLTNDIVLDQYSPTDSTGSVRGGYLTVLNLGYVLAPIITGYILARMGFSSLYTLTAIILIPVIWLAFLAPAASHTHHSKVNIFASLKKLWKTNDLRNIVFANFILQFFYSWMVIYTPLYLHNELGIPWDNMGSIFSIMLFAFVLTQIPFGKLADKFLGEKELLITGFIIMGISTITLYILPYFTLTLLAFILFITRIGASCIEVMTETYFFKKVSSSETGIISIFRNTYPTSYIIAPLIASGVVALAPTKYLFLILGIICFLGILFVIPIRDTK